MEFFIFVLCFLCCCCNNKILYFDSSRNLLGYYTQKNGSNESEFKILHRKIIVRNNIFSNFNAQVMMLFIVIIAYMTLTISAKPLENDSAEIVMKIERINEQLPGNE